MREVIHPEDKAHWLSLRAQDITSTECAALFGLSPYMTLFELWHRKKSGDVVILDENERMKWGTRLQDAIADGIAEDNRWHVRKMEEYIREPETRLGASFDFEISYEADHPTLHGIKERTTGLLEIKNVDALQFRDGWITDGENPEAPPHIEIQVQHQLAVSGKSFAYIGALVGGNRVVLIKREPDPKIIAQIRRKAREFWLSIGTDQEPKPNFCRDASFISELYGYSEPGRTYDALGDGELATLAEEDKRLLKEEKAVGVARDAIKAQILMKIDKAEKVIGDGFSISAGMIGPAEYTVKRGGYRNFRINWKRGKNDKSTDSG